MYGLSEDYKTNPVCRTNQASRNVSLWQVGVYQFVQSLLANFKLNRILDIGCGIPEKLAKYILPITRDIVGLDLPETIEVFKDRLSFGRWYPFNIEAPEITLEEDFDVILASDVIEHLENPDTLLDFIKRQYSKDTFIVLSTPERDTLGVTSLGPPVNSRHVREWNQKEFIDYIESRGFDILESFLVNEPSGHKCHVCVCKLPGWLELCLCSKG